MSKIKTMKHKSCPFCGNALKVDSIGIWYHMCDAINILKVSEEYLDIWDERVVDPLLEKAIKKIRTLYKKDKSNWMGFDIAIQILEEYFPKLKDKAVNEHLTLIREAKVGQTLDEMLADVTDVNKHDVEN